MVYYNPYSKNPELYDMSCPKCAWNEAMVLDPCETDTITLSGEPPRGPRHVTELPKKCPECGARLNKKKLPFVCHN